MASMNIVYKYYDQTQLYVNLTNRCTNKCKFCIRYTDEGVGGTDLWLMHEPDFDEITKALKEQGFENAKEIVFCGYGEPTIRHEILVKVAKFIKENSNAKIRINTNGHGNRVAGYDITPDYRGIIDEISISLNAKSAKEYNELCVCDFGEEGFSELLEFAKCAKENVPSVILSIVDVLPEKDIEVCRKIAEDTGVVLRVRHLI